MNFSCYQGKQTSKKGREQASRRKIKERDHAGKSVPALNPHPNPTIVSRSQHRAQWCRPLYTSGTLGARQ